MLDKFTDLWILRARTSTCLLVFSYFESLKTLKKTPRECFFVQFSLLRPEKYKTYHRRTLLTSEEIRHTFFVLIQEGPKKVNYYLPNAPSRVAYSLSFTSVKECKITQKDPFDYDKWGLQQ